MYVLEDEEINQIHDFLILSGMSQFCEREDDYERYRDEVFRFRDIIRAFDNCSENAGNTYRNAVNLAVATSRTAYKLAVEQQKDNAEEVAFDSYCEVMKEQFYNNLIQYRWKEVNDYKRQTSVLCQGRYRDYLSALNVPSYVEYHPPASV